MKAMPSRRDPGAFSSALDTRAKGRIAETAAVRWLRRHGYQILETNFAIRASEIDVIALEPAEPGSPHGDTLCFIEVKARRNADYGPSLAAVTPRKQHRIALAASAYLIRSEWPGPCRFDVLGMDGTDQGWQFTLIKNAFPAS